MLASRAPTVQRATAARAGPSPRLFTARSPLAGRPRRPDDEPSPAPRRRPLLAATRASSSASSAASPRPGSSTPPDAPPPSTIARWLFDCRYGTRSEAAALLQEWVATVGAAAGCTAQNTRLRAGAVGVPESRLELELSLPSLAAWEQFLGRIDRQAHRAWSERAARLMVDGSTRWEVLRAVPVAATGGGAAAAAAAAASAPPRPAAGNGGGLVFAAPGASVEAAAAEARGDPPAPRDPFADALMSALGASPAGGGADDKGGGEEEEEEERGGGGSGGGDSSGDSGSGGGGSAPLLDWKGEPMQINPGDKLPFKFL
jgi:hypothetical protein